MRLSFGQELRQVQKQILAPRMIQSMEILQLPIMALQERIEQEIQENPVLDVQEEEPEVVEEVEEEINPDAPTVEERELVVDEAKNNEADFERLVEMGEDWPEQFDDQPRMSRNRMDEESDRKHDAMANMISRPQSLHDYLRDQLAWFGIDQTIRQLAERIIYNLDTNGYLQGRLEDLLDPQAGPGELAQLREALDVVQKLDPPGIAARDLRECLLLQIVPGTPYAEQLRTLVGSHLEDIEHNRIPAIERRTGYTIHDIQEALKELRRLNPKPGAAYVETHVPLVVPDVFVEPVDGGGYRIRLEDGNTPSLFISAQYRQLLQSGQADGETREYIKRKINSAQWLIESIEQRRNTLTRVAQAIIDHQEQFLNKGPEFIEPLKMQQIADKVGVHVTTVSRAVDDKWIQTPRGIFPLKRFFGGGTTTASGEEIAWDTIRRRLQEVIDKEDKHNPHSDDELVTELGKLGLTVARRTVTKYRKAMNIPSSRQRRDWSLEENKESSSSASEATPSPDEPEHAEAAPVEAPAHRVFGQAMPTETAPTNGSAHNGHVGT
jgi:RNA polymerase sigma-54 factor